MEISIVIDKLLEHMKSIGFASGTLGNLKRFYAYLIRHSQGEPNKTVPEQIEVWLDDAKREAISDADKRRFIKWYHCGKILEEFSKKGYITSRIYCSRPRGTLPENKCNRKLLENFLQSLQEQGLSRSTQEDYKSVAAKFLVFLEDTEVGNIEHAKSGTIGRFFVWLFPTWKEGSIRSLCGNFRPFLRYCSRDDLVAEVPRR